jgi:1-acyl-sn-glycerol-3-phosphate acyltransferase
MILDKVRAIFTITQMAITLTFLIVIMYIFGKKNKIVRQKWAAIQMKLLGIKLEIEGSEDPNAQMQLMNHQSVLDIILFEYLHSKDLAWISKVEIANIPWFGRIATAPNMILVERESKKSLIKLLKDCKDRLNDNRPIAIFPEGTRTNGKKLLKFKAGARMIAEKYDLLVQPVLILGTREILDSQNLKQNSGIVKVIYMPSVKAEKKTSWYKDMEENMKITLDNNLENKELSNDI